MKKKIILLSVILLLLFLLCYPAEALAAARNGLKLLLETLLPTLLPFLGFLREEPMYFFWDFSPVTLWGQN